MHIAQLAFSCNTERNWLVLLKSTTTYGSVPHLQVDFANNDFLGVWFSFFGIRLTLRGNLGFNGRSKVLEIWSWRSRVQHIHDSWYVAVLSTIINGVNRKLKIYRTGMIEKKSAKTYLKMERNKKYWSKMNIKWNKWENVMIWMTGQESALSNSKSGPKMSKYNASSITIYRSTCKPG